MYLDSSAGDARPMEGVGLFQHLLHVVLVGVGRGNRFTKNCWEAQD